MSSLNHIVRLAPRFFEGTAVHHDGHRLLDNEMNIIANTIAFEVEPSAQYKCEVELFPDDTARAIVLDGRIYDLQEIGEHIDEWLDVGIITELEFTTIAAIFQYLIWQPELTWDLNYHFPCYYDPVRSRGLLSTNIWMMIKQFPSEPYIYTILDNGTIETWDITIDCSEDGDNWEWLLGNMDLE
jgi:hypothetical protein